MNTSIRRWMHGPVWVGFKDYLRHTKSHRNGLSLSNSSINTYHSSVKMFLCTYLRDGHVYDLYNGSIEMIVEHEREMGNNANFSMQSCALRHFRDYLGGSSVGVRSFLNGSAAFHPPGMCGTCLCLPGIRRVCDHSHSCVSTRCFGKCSKLYPPCRLNSVGVCEYCVKKYPILFGAPSTRRSRYVEYVHDHALIGRDYDPSKHDRLIRDEILEAVRWQKWMNSSTPQIARV